MRIGFLGGRGGEVTQVMKFYRSTISNLHEPPLEITNYVIDTYV